MNKLNNHGQTLVLFVILIPVLIIFVAFIVDTGVVINSKTHLKEVSKTAIRENIDIKNEEFIKKAFEKNNIDVKNLKIDFVENGIHIKNEYEIDSIFGSIIGIKTYRIHVDIRGIKKENKIIFE